MRPSRGILVTGGGTFLGDNIAAALLALGAKVSLLARPGTEDKLGPLTQQTRWSTADVWNPASLRGKARFHSAVIHTVGSLTADPARGLSLHWLNFVSARNVANMCVSDGVRRMILLSSANAPWISRDYIRAKREAEDYIRRMGLSASIIRAPLLYAPGHRRPLFYRALSLLGVLPPLSWSYLGRIAPMSADAFARGIAQIAIAADDDKAIHYARDLRRLSRRGAASPITGRGDSLTTAEAESLGAYAILDEDLPFGWSPSDEPPN
ncbi:MAG: NAD(P)H-binding protein [Chloroflexi bacterium]|nr:NAD(P)H-binding protein [Chloroflexota bacterium]